MNHGEVGQHYAIGVDCRKGRGIGEDLTRLVRIHSHAQQILTSQFLWNLLQALGKESGLCGHAAKEDDHSEQQILVHDITNRSGILGAQFARHGKRLAIPAKSVNGKG